MITSVHSQTQCACTCCRFSDCPAHAGNLLGLNPTAACQQLSPCPSLLAAAYSRSRACAAPFLQPMPAFLLLLASSWTNKGRRPLSAVAAVLVSSCWMPLPLVTCSSVTTSHVDADIGAGG
jgi:hypothetical protein